MNHPEARPMDESLLRRTAIRIVKEPAGLYGMPEIRFDADFYCRKLEDPAFCYETEAEYVVYAEHMRLTDACLVRCEPSSWRGGGCPVGRRRTGSISPSTSAAWRAAPGRCIPIPSSTSPA